MPTIRRTPAFLFVFLALSSPGATQINVDYQAPPATEQELANDSAAVIRARSEGRRAVQTPEDVVPMTAYRLRVLEILKGDGRFLVGDAIEVYRMGGDTPTTKDVEFELFEQNDELVLFLGTNPLGRYVINYGPAGAFKLKDGRAHAFTRATGISKRRDGTPADALLHDLRKLKR